MSLIISVSGLRGVVGETLTPDVVVRYLAAFAETLPDGPIVLTRDGRATGPMIVDAARSSLAALGRRVLDAGPAATPTTGVLVRDLKAAGGVQISASHNPAEYNGLKLFGGDGRVIPGEAGAGVRDRYEAISRGEASPTWVAHHKLGRAEALEDATSAHLRLVESIVDVERVRSKQFRVLLDANHGAGAVAGGPLLERLGCEVTVLGATPDGLFDHTPEPTAENLVDVGKRVTDAGAVVGFCQDPDADRLALIDETGRYVGEEYTPAVCVDHVLRTLAARGESGPVVTNCSTSRMTQDLAERHGVPFYHAAVGEANVVDKMLDVGAVVGAEGNGGVIDPRVGLVRDSLVGMALVLDAMAARELPLSSLVDELPRYAIHKAKVPVDRGKIAAALDALQSRFPKATASRLDGLRLDWHEERKWLLVRASNTEPIVRLFCEAPSAEDAEATANAAAAVLA
ncbi:MAG: phosphoglucosamine mutase [Planctomycetota bacterium]